MENPVPILAVGDVVNASAAALLAKLDITPFSYGMKVTGVYDDGVMLDEAIISMAKNDYARKFMEAMNNVNAISM